MPHRRPLMAPRIERIPTGKLQTPDIGIKLIRRYGLHGKSQVTGFADQVFPVVVVDDLTSVADWWQLPVPAGERRYWGYSTVAPVVGQLPLLALENTAGSGLVMRVESVSFLASSTDVMRWGYLISFPGAPADNFGVRDSRQLGGIAPFLIRESTNAATQVSPILAESVGTGVAVNIPVDLVLNPGERFGIEREVANTQLNAGIYFTVRNAIT